MMNKKEQAEVAELRHKLEVLAALRWTEAVTPDVPIPDSKGLTKGFLTGYAGSDTPGVDRACSSSIYHARGRDDKTTTHGARELYSTRLLALKALRHEMEMHFANKLARVDAMIENEKAGTA